MVNLGSPRGKKSNPRSKREKKTQKRCKESEQIGTRKNSIHIGEERKDTLVISGKKN